MANRDLRTSMPCLRNHHEGCTAPSSCECDCHLAAEAADAGMVWEDPPPITRAGRNRRVFLTGEQAEALKAHPKRWARICEVSKSTASKYRQRAADEHQGFEFESRRVSTTRAALYARWVGNP